jgi:CMP-N-acetylneuraminic acid synthetase
MKSIIIFPIKQYSERLPGKNFLPVAGVPLYRIFTLTCRAAGVFSRVVVDSDSEEILAWARGQGMGTLARLPHLAADTANGNDLLRHHVMVFPGYDLYWQAFVTSPAITVGTVRAMYQDLDRAVRRDSHDSILSVRQLRGHFWDAHGMPINHRPELMPRSQDAPPIYQEVCGLFGVTVTGFHRSGTRAGARPLFHVLPEEEAADIDWPADLARAATHPAANPPPTGDA